MFVTAETAKFVDLAREVGDALRAAGLEVREVNGALTVDGSPLVLHIVDRAHPTPADLRQLVDQLRGRHPAVVVADRISDPGRDVLRSAGWGWLDRRGHVRVWTPGVRIEVPVPGRDGDVRPRGGNPWTTVGLEVALAALITPTEPVTARRVAPRIDRSVGATHEVIARFTDVGLVGPTTHLPLLPELFWEAAAHWPDDDWTPLPISIVELAEEVGGDALVRVDERAATLGGARIPAAGDAPARCYVTSTGALRRARRLSDAARDTRCWVRRPPVQWLPDNPDHPPSDAHPWFVGHPILCALRLAADPSRGREIVDDWGIVAESTS